MSTPVVTRFAPSPTGFLHIGGARTALFNLLFTRPLKKGKVTAEGRWVSGKRLVFVADSRLIDSDGEEIARGTGTFMRSHIPLASLPGYKADD